MSDSEKKLVYTIKETADLLSTSVRTIWTLIEEKELSTLKIRKSTKITREEIERYVKQQKEKNGL